MQGKKNSIIYDVVENLHSVKLKGVTNKHLTLNHCHLMTAFQAYAKRVLVTKIQLSLFQLYLTNLSMVIHSQALVNAFLALCIIQDNPYTDSNLKL